MDQLVVYALVLFMFFAAVDRIVGGKLGLGSKFEEAFAAMGPLSLSMAGIMVSSDLIGAVLIPTVGKLFRFFGGDPCMAGSLVLSMDTGAYTLAHAISPENTDVANFSAIILGSMMGPTIAFNIPVALRMMKKDDLPCLAYGTLCAILCIPFGCLVGGILAGFNLSMVIKNSFPILLFSVLIAAGLWFFPAKMIQIFSWLSKAILCYLTLMLALSILQENSSFHLIPLRPLSEVWLTVGMIVTMLAGAYPLMLVISRILKKPLKHLSTRIGIEEKALVAMLAATVNSLPALTAVHDLAPSGKTSVIAFTCCTCFALGDYLSFCASVAPHMIFPMILGKLLSGVLSIFVARLIWQAHGGNRHALTM